LKTLRVALAVCTVLVAGALLSSSTASAASCPTGTFLSFDHLAYATIAVPPTVRLVHGSPLGGGTVDEPTSPDGCKRARNSVQVLTAGSIDPHVAVLVAGRPLTAFVIGSRCAGSAVPAYWDCLLRPLVFRGQQFTATSYPRREPAHRTVPLGAAIGKAKYHGQTVTVRHIDGVDPSLAVGISGRPSDAFLSPRTCPYGGFSNNPQYDNLLRCLRSPVWFTFDPPGSEVGGTLAARSDRPVPAAVAGAGISLVALPVVADFVPPRHGPLVLVGHVADQVNLRVPNVSPGLYEAVVSCPGCAPRPVGGGTLYPAGSFLVTPKQKTSLGIQIVSYALAIAVVAAAILTFKTWRRRRRLGLATTRPGWGRSSRRGRSSSADASAPPPARAGRAPAASPRATPAAPPGRGGRRGKNAGRRGRKRGAG
jgi:hypothetical protein